MNWTRREFVKRSAAGFAVPLLTNPLELLGEPLRAEFRHLRGDVGYFTDRGGTIGWLNTLSGCVVIDSQFPDTAENFLVELRDVGGRPVHALINTHHHADHTSGNGVLRYVVREIVAHERSLANQRRSAAERGVEAEQVYPDTTFTDSWSLKVADEVVQAKYYGPAHTDGDVAVSFQNANIVHLGDLVNNGGYPNIDAAAGASAQGWVRVLEAISAERDAETLYVFGHADAGRRVTGTREDLLRQRDYFTGVLEAAERAIREGRTREQAVALTSLPGFENLGGAVARLGLALGVAYDELSTGQAAR